MLYSVYGTDIMKSRDVIEAEYKEFHKLKNTITVAIQSALFNLYGDPQYNTMMRIESYIDHMVERIIEIGEDEDDIN
jgi:hypothetical protein